MASSYSPTPRPLASVSGASGKASASQSARESDAAAEPVDQRKSDPQIDHDPGFGSGFGIALSAALIAVRHDEPMVLLLAPGTVVDGCERNSEVALLPSGVLLPHEHSSLENGLRDWVAHQAGIELGYFEQLYTFCDPNRLGQVASKAGPNSAAKGVGHDASQRGNALNPQCMVSIGYLALVGSGDARITGRSQWVKCYDILPWEDWRGGRPAILDVIEPQLREWVDRPGRLLGAIGGQQHSNSRQARIDLAFGLNGASWDDERAFERHEILYEVGLLSEARRDVSPAGIETDLGRSPDVGGTSSKRAAVGVPLGCDHRRMLAMAIGRLRAKIKYRPIVFQLMDEEFTLFELQRTVEAVLGTPLHKQNFRRLVETTGLVEEVGDVRAKTGGRPAKLFKFRPDVMLERPATGVRVKSVRH
jgi:hypothetical protein